MNILNLDTHMYCLTQLKTSKNLFTLLQHYSNRKHASHQCSQLQSKLYNYWWIQYKI